MNYLLQLDKSVFYQINTGWSSAVFDFLMPWITHLGDTNAVWFFILAAGALKIKQLHDSPLKDESLNNFKHINRLKNKSLHIII